MKMLIRPPREHFQHFLKRAGAIVQRYEKNPRMAAGILKPPSMGVQKYDRKLEVAQMGNLAAVTPGKIRVEEKRPSAFGRKPFQTGQGKKLVARGMFMGKRGK